MSNFGQLVDSLREQMQANLSRSDVLRPLAWLVGLLLMALVSTLATQAPAWVVAALLIALAGSLILYLGAYIFCLLVDRDALRSERYTLHKMAIESGLYGDSRIGLIEPIDDKAGVQGLIGTNTASEAGS